MKNICMMMGVSRVISHNEIGRISDQNIFGKFGISPRTISQESSQNDSPGKPVQG